MYQVYPFISHIGFTWAVPPYVFMAALNHAINFIYAYWWYKWSWQHRKDSYTQICWDRIRIRTTRPITSVDRFYCWSITPINCWECWQAPDLSGCNTPVSNCKTCNWKEIDMIMVAPHADLNCWQYQLQNDISYYNPDWPWCRYDPENPCGKNWTELVSKDCDECSIQPDLICGMWGMWGNRIELKLPNNCWCICNVSNSWLWVTYYRWPQHLTSMKDYIYMPQWFTTVLAFLTAHFLLPAHGIARQYDDVNYYNRAIAMMQELMKHETSFADKITSDYA